jgi:hypothetical protein
VRVAMSRLPSVLMEMTVTVARRLILLSLIAKKMVVLVFMV